MGNDALKVVAGVIVAMAILAALRRKDTPKAPVTPGWGPAARPFLDLPDDYLRPKDQPVIMPGWSPAARPFLDLPDEYIRPADQPVFSQRGGVLTLMAGR